MPVKQLRCDFFFNDLNLGGFSESFATTLQDYEAAMAKCLALRPLRVACLGASAFMIYIRVSDMLVQRDSRVQKISFDDGRNLSAVGGSASSDLSLLIRYDSSPFGFRLHYMRGFPDTCESDSGVYTPTTTFRNNLNLYLGSILDGTWAIRQKDQTLNPLHLITAATQDLVTGNVTVTTADPHAFPLDKPILIRGVRGATQINGRWALVGNAPANQFRIQVNRIIDPYVSGGTVQLLGYTLQPIVGQNVLRITHRIAGGPFGRRRGRRRVKRR